MKSTDYKLIREEIADDLENMTDERWNQIIDDGKDDAPMTAQEFDELNDWVNNVFDLKALPDKVF